MSKPNEIPLATNMFLSGTAGCCAWLVTHPFELLKNRVILNPDQSFSTVFADTKKGGFWKGLSGGIARQVVYASCRLGFYDPIKDLVTRDPQNVTGFDRATAGALAGMSAAMLSSPIEVCLVLQSKATAPLSLVAAGKQVLTESGPTGFWRGGIPLMSRAGVVGVSQVAMYDQSKATLKKLDKKYDWGMSGTTEFILASTFTALFYAFVTMPIELSRVRMSSQKKGAVKYTSMHQAIALIAREEGAMSIYSSFAPYFMRCAVHTVTAFFIIDTIKPLLVGKP